LDLLSLAVKRGDMPLFDDKKDEGEDDKRFTFGPESGFSFGQDN